MGCNNLTRKDRSKIFEMHDQGKGAAVCREIGCSLPTARAWLNKAAMPKRSTKDKRRSGRPKIVTADMNHAARRQALRGKSAPCIAQSCQAKTGIKVSPATVRRVLKGGYKPLEYKPQTLSQTLSLENRAKRLHFCRKFPNIPHRPWIFIDGSILTLYDGGKKNGWTWSWRRADDPAIVGQGKLVAHFFVYAAVGEKWRSRLHFVAPSGDWRKGLRKGVDQFTGTHYVTFMKELMLELLEPGAPGQVWIIRDHAPQHMSHASQAAMKDNNIPILESFPARSWDITCIEHVWARFKKIVGERRPSSIRGFQNAILLEHAEKYF